MNVTVKNPIKFGKTKQRSQMCEVFTEDGRILTMELEVLRGCADDPTSKQAFILDSSNQYVNIEDKTWTQPLWEPSTKPLRMINQDNDEDLEKLIDEIYNETWHNTIHDQYENVKKNEMENKIVWVVSLVCTAAVIIALIQWAGG